MYKRGNRWYSDFWYKGERYIESHGPVSKTVAREKDRGVRSKVASGEYTKAKSNPTFIQAIDEHLKKSQTENQPSTYERNLLIARYLREHFGDRRIRAIEGNEVLIRKYIKKQKKQIREKQLKLEKTESEVTYTSINRELAFLRSMFNVLIKAKMNPVSLVTFFEEI